MKAPLALLAIVLLPAAAWGQALRGSYHPGRVGCPALPAAVVLARDDQAVDFDSTDGSRGWPMESALAADSPFTARWSGILRTHANGQVTFRGFHDDESLLLIDGVAVWQRLGLPRAASAVEGTILLAAGPHLVDLCYSHQAGRAVMRLDHRATDATVFTPLPVDQIGPHPVFGAHVRALDFDDVPEGTYLTDQFAAPLGITFVQSIGPGMLVYSRPVVAGSVATSSPTKLLRNESRDPLEATQISGNVPLSLSFTRGQAQLALDAGVEEVRFGGNPAAIFRGYDARGFVVAADRIAVVDASVTSRLSLVRGSSDIVLATIDFGPDFRDERVDTLRFESSFDGTAPADGTPPVVEILSPLPGPQPVASVALAVDVRVRETSGVVRSVTAHLDGATTSTTQMERTAISDPDCIPPTCGRYHASFLAANGEYVVRVEAADGAGNVGHAEVTVIFTGATDILVVNEAGSPRGGAEIFIDGRLHHEVTGPDGRVRIVPPLPAGTRLVARYRVHEQGTFRGSHSIGSTQDWSYRVYQTSVEIDAAGNQSVHEIAVPFQEQVLTLRRRSALIGLHLMGALEWDATSQQIASHEEMVRRASDYLYNATDGQFFIEQVEITDRGQNWGDADYHVYARHGGSLRAHVEWPLGSFLGRNFAHTSSIHLARDDGSATFAHEFGHYGFDLGDEYQDNNPNVFCTSAVVSFDARFGIGGPSASCMMFNQLSASKLCSGHPDNPHVANGSPPCWAHLASRYDDLAISLVLRRPDTRGAIPASMMVPVGDWTPRTTMLSEFDRPLCNEFPVDTGTPGVDVWVQEASGRFIRQGSTDITGRITVVGAHPLDWIWVGPRILTRLEDGRCPLQIP